MRMHFDSEDETAFHARRDELGAQFATWLTTHDVPGDPDDAGLLMDWKWGYDDGALDRWTVDHVRGFLFGWCPRTLAAAPADCAEVPISVAAFVEFLAHTGLLGPGSDPPTRIRKFCVRSVSDFVREMGNPANFGMAKSLFGGAPDAPRSQVEALLHQLDQLPPEVLDAAPDGVELPEAVIGPVRLPAEDERRAAVRAAPIMAKLRALTDLLATPGREPGRADIAHLDDPDAANPYSVEYLPEKRRLVEIAREAGAIRRLRGRLVTVRAFTELDEVTAHERVVRAALGWPIDEPPDDDGYAVPILLELLDPDTGAGGVAVETLVENIRELDAAPFGLGPFAPGRLDAQVAADLDLLLDLGLVSITGDAARLDGQLTLTPCGVCVAVEVARDLDIEVVLRPDPGTAEAAAIVDLIGLVDQAEWERDAAAWLAAQPDPAAAGSALVAEITAEHRPTAVALTGLEAIEAVLGGAAADAIRPQLGGPHDGAVLHWLVGRSALDPNTVDPVRYLRGVVDVLAAALDSGASADELLGSGHDTAAHLALLDEIWRIDHPRLPEVLETVGADHHVKAVAKAARKALVRYRSRLASQRSTKPR